MRRLPTVLGAVLTLTVVAISALAPPVAAGDGSPGAHDVRPGRTPTADGQIVFRRYFNAAQTKAALFVMNPDGSQVRQVTHPPDSWRDNVPAWSPDGRTIVFERFASDDSTSRVVVVDPDTGATHTVVPCTGRCVLAIDPYFTPDGRSIAYSRLVAPPGAQHPPEWKIYSAVFIVRLDRGNPHQVTSTPSRRRGVPAVETSDPTLSPDGRLLAFIRTRGGPEEGSAVFVQPMGSPDDAQRITPWRMGCQDRPTFSPDGRHLLFRCAPQGEDGPSNLYLVHPDGTALHRLTPVSARRQYLGSGFSPGFRRGSGWITAGRTGGVGPDGNADVFGLLVDDGQVVRTVNLTRSEEWDSGPGWGRHPPVG